MPLHRQESAIVLKSEQLSHTEACRISQIALQIGSVKTVVIDLTRAVDATTSAFARLVLLRRALLQTGRDLRLTGLHARAASLYEVNRLTAVLPVL